MAGTIGDAAATGEMRPRVVLFSSDFLGSLWLVNRLTRRPELEGAAITIVRTRRPGAGKMKRPSPPEFRLYFYELFEHVLQPRLRGAATPPDAVMRSYERLAEDGSIDVIETDDVNASEAVRELAETPGYAGAMCNRFTEKISGDLVRRLRSRGFFWNLHGGLLPGWRGLMSLYHMRLADCEEGGHSLHELIEEVDRGAILVTERRAFAGEPFMLPVDLALTDATVAPIAGLIGDQISGRAPRSAGEAAAPPDDVYKSNCTAEDMQALKAKGVATCDARTYLEIVARAFLGAAALTDASVLKEIEAYIASRRAEN